MELNREKLPIIYDCLKEYNVDAWLIVGRETAMRSEPILPVLGDLDFIIATALIFTKEGRCIAVVSPLDVEGYKMIAGIDEVIEYPGSFQDTLKEVIAKLNPPRLALNYSRNDAAGDGLSVGNKMMLDKIFKEINYQGEVISAHDIIKKVRGIKTATQIAKIKHCAEVALDYLLRMPSILKEGSTSGDIFRFLQDETAFKDGYGMSWAPSQCPGVSVDPNVPQGHMGLIDTPVVKGCVINIDYGVSKDGYCSDLQRMYYVLKDDESEAPAEVVRAFNTVRDAILMAKEALRPGVTGYDVDKVARSHIVSEGYDSWNAALGHQVGHVTHDGGTILANRRPRYNRPELIDVPLDEGNVFTLEPGVEIPQGRVGIEEMAVITSDGAEFLVPPQQEIICVRLKKGD
ncbi:MAG: M24 family metallopeptidase [Erysipelotrichaceae bacterium]|jgi:Xaa-Pro aminopeptidase|nr:M24 family metallopeptidase [Erysipelotrichaceae bacterium]